MIIEFEGVIKGTSNSDEFELLSCPRCGSTVERQHLQLHVNWHVKIEGDD